MPTLTAVAALGPTTVSGLPAHILLVHLTLVVIPTAAVVMIVAAASTRLRRWLGVVSPLLALVALIMVPITRSAGLWLYNRVPHTPLIDAHMHRANHILPWVIALFVVSVGEWIWFRSLDREEDGSRFPLFAAAAPDEVSDTRVKTASRIRTPGAGPVMWQTIVATVLALVVGIGATVELVRVGESGSRAVYQGNFTTNPH
jgi:hypothetical protein